MPRLHEDSPNGKPNPNISFTGAKLDWMTAAAYDRRLPPSYFEVAFVIAQHINEKTGKGFPSEAWIAEFVGTSVSTVKRAVKLLAETRWLSIRRKRTYDPKTKTWKTRNVYTLRFENVSIMQDAMTASRLGRGFKRITGDTLQGVTHDPVTPSYKHLQKERESTEGVHNRLRGGRARPGNINRRKGWIDRDPGQRWRHGSRDNRIDPRLYDPRLKPRGLLLADQGRSGQRSQDHPRNGLCAQSRGHERG